MERSGRKVFVLRLCKRHNTPDIEKHPLGCLLRTLKDVDKTAPFSGAVGLLNTKVSDNVLKIYDCQYVASYNWLNSTQPTIVTPGRLVFFKINLILTQPRKAPKMDASQGPSKVEAG